MSRSSRRLPLSRVQLVGPGRPAARYPGDWINPIGFTWWTGVGGLAACFTTKQVVFLGPLVLRGLDLRGLFNKRRREELTAVAGGSMGLYLKTWWRYLFVGRPLRRLDETVHFGPRDQAWSLRARR